MRRAPAFAPATLLLLLLVLLPSSPLSLLDAGRHGPVGAAAAVPAASARLPDEGHFTFTSLTNGPFVGVVHAVRRTGDATLLYLSVGTTEPDLPARVGGSELLGFGSFWAPDSVQQGLFDARLLDVPGGKAYRPLVLPGGKDCLCTPLQDGVPEFDPARQLVTFELVFPPLPAGVDRVDVDANGRGTLATSVPVREGGPLEPTAGSGSATVMGTGWPAVDLTQVAAVGGTAPFVTDLLASRSDLRRLVRRTTTPRAETIELASGVLFSVDSSRLSPVATARLSQVARDIDDRARGTVTVTGYTDSTGSAAHGLVLSRARAASVVAALRPLVRGSATFRQRGLGEADPVADNQTAEGRALNRRVEIQFAVRGTS